MEETKKVPQDYVSPDPFPHLIIKNLYNEEELTLIWEELDFLTKPHKFKQDDSDQTAKTENGMLKSYSKAINLDNVYTDRLTSNILTLNRKIFEEERMRKFSEISPMCKSLLYQNNDATKIRYYEEGDEYLPHVDINNFTAITFFYKEPKSFEGGELFFPEFNYTFDCKNNHVILFPGCILHTAKKVKMFDKSPCSGRGRYSMMQFLKII